MRKHSGGIPLLLFGLFLVFGGCETIASAWDAGASLINRAAEAVAADVRTEEDNKAIAEAAKLCAALKKQATEEGYGPEDIENMNPKDREKLRLCMKIFQAFMEFDDDASGEGDAENTAALKSLANTLDDTELTIVTIFLMGDVDEFEANIYSLYIAGDERLYTVIATIDWLVESKLRSFNRANRKKVAAASIED